MNELEQESSTCFSIVAEVNNVNLDLLIQNIENNLIDEGQLDGTKGSDYVAFLEKMQSKNETSHLAINTSTTLFLELNNLPVLANCKNRFDNDNYEGSTAEALDQAIAQLAVTKYIDPKAFAEAFLNNLEETDYSKKYYKIILWKTYADLFIVGPEPGISALLPQKQDNQYNLTASTCPTASIELTSSDVIIWNNQELAKDKLFDSVSVFIRKSKESSNKYVELNGYGTEKITDYILYLNADPYTSYGLYIEINDILNRSINELRTETSMRIFNKDYFELDDVQFTEIKSIITRTIIEK